MFVAHEVVQATILSVISIDLKMFRVWVHPKREMQTNKVILKKTTRVCPLQIGKSGMEENISRFSQIFPAFLEYFLLFNEQFPAFWHLC